MKCKYDKFEDASEGILIQQKENEQSARQLRFNNLQEIIEKQTIIKTYIYEAIEIEKRV